MSTGTQQSRRELRREQTVEEIKTLAMDQVVRDGPDAVSLNAIARTMRVSPASLYRYFNGRDALLADLVVDAYDGLAGALEVASRAEGSAEHRLRTVLHATRAWALAQPNAYRLIFQSTAGSGHDLDPTRTIPAASRSMAVLLTALAETAAPPRRSNQPRPGDTTLLEELARWGTRSGLPRLSPELLRLGFLTWTRLHGVLSLELGHHLASTGVEPALLYTAEVDVLVREALTRP